MSPMIFAVERISIRWVAVISPLTLPHTTIESARICAVATALSPIVISLPSISPSMLPSMNAGPSKWSLRLAFPVIRRVQKSLPEKGIKITLDDMTGWFRTASQAQLQQEVEDRFLGVYGMTLAAFKRDGYQMLGPQEFPQLNDAIRSFNLGIQFLVFGLEGRFGHIFEVNDPNGPLITEHDLKGYGDRLRLPHG